MLNLYMVVFLFLAFFLLHSIINNSRYINLVLHSVLKLHNAFSAIKKIYEMKKNHHLVLGILIWLSIRVSKLGEAELHECAAYDSMLQAAKSGIIEFINSMRHANPDLLWAMDKNRRGIFSHAILCRQEKVFQLIHEVQGRKEIIASREDVFGNNMLHLAAESGPSSYLSNISNSALQMQRELQWFNVIYQSLYMCVNFFKEVFG